MKITIVYDNKVYKKGLGLKSDWGFSCLVESDYDNVLFDTGAKGEILLNNINKLNINPSMINNIVISHNHWDHNGGLNFLSEYLENVALYQLDNKKPIEKMKLLNAENPQKINDKIWTTGRIKGNIDEQSLLIKGKLGWFILTGCSHPGVEKILKKSEKIVDNIVGIIGGFHDFKNFSVLKKLKYISPCHCTAKIKELKIVYPEKNINCGVGKTIDLDVIT